MLPLLLLVAALLAKTKTGSAGNEGNMFKLEQDGDQKAILSMGSEFVLQMVPPCAKKLPRSSPKRSMGVQNEACVRDPVFAFYGVGSRICAPNGPNMCKKNFQDGPKRSTGVQNEGKRHKMEPDGAQKAILSILGPPGPEKILLLGHQKGAQIDKTLDQTIACFSIRDLARILLNFRSKMMPKCTSARLKIDAKTM